MPSSPNVEKKLHTIRVTLDITEDATGEALKFHDDVSVWYRCKERDVVLMTGELIEMLRRMNQHAADRLKK